MKRIDLLLSSVPFSANFGGQDLRSLLPAWTTRNSSRQCEGGQIDATAWSDPASGLKVTMHLRRFADFPAVDWFIEITNTGQGPSAILQQVQALDAALDVQSQRVELHYANGSLCQVDDFLPQQAELGARYDRTFAPAGGRSSNGIFPFMSFQMPGGGILMGIGWSGQWAARINRDKEQLKLTVGQQTTHLSLGPGETIRTPRVLMLEWQGQEAMNGQNLLRQLLLAHYLPRIGGKVPDPPVAQCLQFYYYQTGQAGEHLEHKALPRAAELGVDTYWIDACWYGRTGRNWWEEVGSWVVQPDRFPHGIKPIADAAHAKGMRFVLWFEPERVRKDSILAQEHPEFLLKSPHDKDNLLLNLGDTAAWSHITDLLSDHIAQIGVDIFRQDFNFDPLPYWQAADAPDRVGMTENLYIQGFYRLWDELLRRHPNIWIDNCASGGRRIDLETLSRSLPLWPSDFNDTAGLMTGMNLHIGDQCENAGLARWVPVFGGGMWNFEPYSVRSQAIGGFTFGTHIAFEHYRGKNDGGTFDFASIAAKGQTLLGEAFPVALAQAAIAEHRSLQPYITGDFWPLLPLTVSPHDWCAYQLHRHDLDAGFALFFRRHESPFDSMRAGLRWIDDPKSYKVTLSQGYDPLPERTMSGRQLVDLLIRIDQQPGSVLVRYAQA